MADVEVSVDVVGEDYSFPYDLNEELDEFYASIEDRLQTAFEAMEDIEDDFEELEDEILNAFPDVVDTCYVMSLINSINSIKKKITDIENKLTNKISESLSGITNDIQRLTDEVRDKFEETSAKIIKGIEDYLGFGIIMKKYQILKYKMRKAFLVVSRKVAEISKSVFMWVLDGKGSWFTTPINAVLAAISSLSAAINGILTALGILLGILDKAFTTFMGGIAGASCCFFMTPKSIIKHPGLSVPINANVPITDPIPKAAREAVHKMIDTAMMSAEQLYANSKVARIGMISAKAAADALTGNFSFDSYGSVSFSKEEIKKNLDHIINTVLMFFQEPLPRYEKLSIVKNPRFLLYLLQAFEPAAKQTFGIPGFA